MFGRKKQQQLDPIALAQAQRDREQAEVAAAFQKGITELRDFIAPASLEFKSSSVQIGTRLARTKLNQNTILPTTTQPFTHKHN
jgi:hypothetical protein